VLEEKLNIAVSDSCSIPESQFQLKVIALASFVLVQP